MTKGPTDIKSVGPFLFLLLVAPGLTFIDIATAAAFAAYEPLVAAWYVVYHYVLRSPYIAVLRVLGVSGSVARPAGYAFGVDQFHECTGSLSATSHSIRHVKVSRSKMRYSNERSKLLFVEPQWVKHACMASITVSAECVN
jgi:hypothetical protein